MKINTAIAVSTAVLGVAMITGAANAAADYPIRAASIRDVKVTGGFWLPRLETNRVSTLLTDFEKCEVARIPNFRNAAKRKWGTFKGIPFDDSDVYKVIEGAAYTLATHPDKKLEEYVDSVIDAIAGAQERDGYLYTARTLGHIYKGKDGKPHYGRMGETRWAFLAHSHEFYNVGHLYEAAVAWYEATGKRNLLDVAIKSANLIDRTFGPEKDKLKDTAGHQEIELALCRLYRTTGEKKYLNLAKFLIDMRGRVAKDGTDMVSSISGSLVKNKYKSMKGAYCQNHKPVTEQREAVGHAVRATYLYCGMADVAALTGSDEYATAINAIWENVVGKKLHLNGSVGAQRRGEAFGGNYELPNETAYLETCAGIGNVLWNQRMFLTYGDAKYVDVMERGLYNGVISGISFGGDEFFYPNPMASLGGYKRSKWFGCSCCPVNVVRFIPQIVNFAYATREDSAYVNLFVESEAKLRLSCGDVSLVQKTAYPWKGDVALDVTPPKDGARFAINIRIPGWCVGRPVPSDLYEQTVPGSLDDFKVKVNGSEIKISPVKGYCVVEREWKRGDKIEVSMAMPVRRIKAHRKVKDNIGRLAVERGPILYCAEGVDNNDRVLSKSIAADAEFADAIVNIKGLEFPALKVAAKSAQKTLFGKASVKPCELTLVPYFAWCHRGAGEMQTWFPVEPRESDAAVDARFKVSFAPRNEKGNGSAILSGKTPKSSNDHDIPRVSFWDHRGTEEWVSYEFGNPQTISGVQVYWFDDRAKNGGCRIPESWNVETRPSKDAPWERIDVACPVVLDGFSRVTFPKKVKAQAVRIAVRNQKDFSGGLLNVTFFE